MIKQWHWWHCKWVVLTGKPWQGYDKHRLSRLLNINCWDTLWFVKSDNTSQRFTDWRTEWVLQHNRQSVRPACLLEVGPGLSVAVSAELITSSSCCFSHHEDGQTCSHPAGGRRQNYSNHRSLNINTNREDWQTDVRVTHDNKANIEKDSLIWYFRGDSQIKFGLRRHIYTAL